MIRAIIFDFDGLILETEGPSYDSWQEVYQSFGLSLPFASWATIIGSSQGGFDPRLDLQKRVKERIDWDEVERKRRKSEIERLEKLTVLPGVEQYLKDARRMGLKTGLASSSSCKWVTGHLTRLGLVDYFDCICASDDVKNTKPDPELYQSVLRGLDVSAEEAIALEDSPNGIRAAKQAGLYCVAVPNPLTRQLTFDQADLRLSSLEELTLEQLVDKIEIH